MEATHEDRFLVFVREADYDPYDPDTREVPLADCSTYEEARRISRAHRERASDCVIRFVGPTGGGD